MSDTTITRAPMLHVSEFDRMCEDAVKNGKNEVERVFQSAAAVMEYFEGKITSGELIVAKQPCVMQYNPNSCWVDISPLPDQHQWKVITLDEFEQRVRGGAKVVRPPSKAGMRHSHGLV